jgi:hypothetical protein
MAGLGAAVLQIDPSMPLTNMILLAVKAGIGACVGAYFGNHVSQVRRKRIEAKKSDVSSS